ncbi:hypothetical protein LWI29_023194 [Acer saccharum]|uniref:Disease resistance N-terminal domain-containing protein n=1 Tax=Acer saccharum TaxID=4024 RepID=A0AA39RK98_ACESA|nr:hypothetical protein LWI29_023194 [Acer saccharum]
MAELAISSFLGEILSSWAKALFPRMELKEKLMKDLKSNLLSLVTILDAAESKEYDQNKELKLWLDRLKEVSYELEDLLNEIATKESRRQLEAESWKIKYRVRRIISINNLRLFEKDIKHRQKWITAEIEDLQRNKEKFGLEYYGPMTARKPDQLSVSKEGHEDESQARRSSVKKDKGRKRFQLPTSSLMVIPEVIGRREDMDRILKLLISVNATENIVDVISIVVTDGNKMQQKNDDEIASKYLEHRTDVSSQSHSSPPELSMLSTELAHEKQVHEGNSRREKIMDRPSTSGLSEVEELQLPDTNVVRSTDVSITTNRPPPESPTRLTEDSSAKHGGALDTFSPAIEISSDTDTDDPINDEGEEARFRRIEEGDRPSTSGLQEIEVSQLPDSDVVRRTDCLATSNSTPPESSKDSSAQHVDASDNSSASTEISSDNDDEGDKVQFRRNEKLPDRPSTSRLPDPINDDSDVVQITDVSATSNRPPSESPTPLTEDSSAKHEAATENLSDTDTDTDDPINVSEISQLKRLSRRLYSLKIESCKALESLPEELVSVNLQQLYIIDCQYLKSIQASHLPTALKTLYIRRCKKLEFLSTEETTGKHTSVEHLCIESSCDPQKSFPLALFPKLQNLTIWDCVNFNSISITEDHMSLNSLEIRDCTNLESLSKGGLRTPNLTSILLSNCKNLKQLPGQLQELKFLQSLFINECPELDSIPEGGLPSSLNLLRISSCHKLTPGLQWGLHQLNNFSRIEIEGGCRDLASFPEQNLLPRNLNSLQISRFPNLKILNYKGLQHLTSLQTLKINSCDKLQSLPEEGLPSSLSYLYISDCPLLKSKLHNNREDWYKIAHIPHIQIDEKVMS